MNSILKVGKESIILTLEPQTGVKGIAFRLSGTSLVMDKHAKWVNGLEKRHVIHHFIYCESKERFSFEFDYNDLFVCKIT